MRLRRGRVCLPAREGVPAARDMRLAAREKFILSGIGFPLYTAILGKIKFYNSKWNIRKPCMQRRAWGCSQHEEIDFLLYGEVISFACKCEVTTPFVVL